jgi:predicted nucleic-acid-binding Zn-ribbon protein
MCIYPECKKQPYYNKEGELKALYCSSHKLENMVDVKNKTCIHPDCKKQPLFNKEGESKRLYCSGHKLENMVDVKNKTCIHPDCKKQPHYNKDGELKALFCSSHKLENMVNVINKTCIHPKCKKQPAFNKYGESKRLYCAEHKLENMVDVKNKTCIYPECKKQRIYNKEGEINALYCSVHKLENMVDVKNKTCKSNWCSTIVREKYDGYCLFCYMNLFPDKPVSHNYKTKEYAVIEHVKNKFSNYNWIADKIVNGGCSKRRPDLLLDLLYQIVIIEVDENQHTDYDCSCQNKRIMELSQDLGHRPIVFIRFNPDNYEQNGTNITSCWGQNKNGICVVKPSKKDEWSQRLKTLEEHISYWITPTNMTNKTIETIQLFYDV